MAKMQNDLAVLKRTFLKATNYLASINFPIYGFMALFAPFIVDILFGDDWENLIPIVQVLCVYGALRSIGNPLGSLIVARGQYKLGFWWNFTALSLIVPTVYLGSFYGLIGVCWGLSILGFCMLIPSWRVLVYKLCGAKFFEYHKQIIIPFTLTVATYIVTFFIEILFVSNFYEFIICMILSGIMLLVLNFKFNKEFSLNMLSMIKLKGFKLDKSK
jgi:O-antigen/teichoic acid export membrane protein